MSSEFLEIVSLTLESCGAEEQFQLLMPDVIRSLKRQVDGDLQSGEIKVKLEISIKHSDGGGVIANTSGGVTLPKLKSTGVRGDLREGRIKVQKLLKQESLYGDKIHDIEEA